MSQSKGRTATHRDSEWESFEVMILRCDDNRHAMGRGLGSQEDVAHENAVAGRNADTIFDNVPDAM